MQAMAVAAMRGGVLAGLTVLELWEREEACLRASRRPYYDYWAAFKWNAEKQFGEAAAAGLPEPSILPHPDDIALDPNTLLVKFLGPVDEEGLEVYVHIRTIRDLFFELMVYTGTTPIIEGPREKNSIGLLGLQFISYHTKLPPRFRCVKMCVAQIDQHVRLGHYAWTAGLRRRCTEKDFDPDFLMNKKYMRTFSMDALGFRYENGLPVADSPKNKRDLKKLLAEKRRGLPLP